MALANMDLKTKIGLILGRRTKREEGEKREEEKRKRKKRRGRRRNQAKVWNFGFLYGTNLGYEFLYEFPYNCMVICCTQT